MQDEINEKTIALYIKTGKLTAQTLQKAMKSLLAQMKKNFTTLLEMINASEAREDDAEFQSPVDLMFERLEEKDPEHFAVRQYKKFLLSAGKTRYGKSPAIRD